MPKFEVEGFGRTTGRTRCRAYEAEESAKGAIEKAVGRRHHRRPLDPAAGVPDPPLLLEGRRGDPANRDGSDRQKIVFACRRNEVLSLRREPRNRYSAHAVAVLRASGEQVGCLPDETAEGITARMDGGCLVFCCAMDQTGGQPFEGKPTTGLNLLLVVAEDADTPTTALQAYLDAHARRLNR